MDVQRTLYLLPMPLPRPAFQVEIHRWRNAAHMRTSHSYYAVRPELVRRLLLAAGFHNTFYPPFRIGLSMMADTIQLRIPLPGRIVGYHDAP